MLFKGNKVKILRNLSCHAFTIKGQVMVAANFSLPDNMSFGEAQIIAIVVYSIMLAIGVTANLSFLYHLMYERLVTRKKNRMSMLLIHLAIADLLVKYILSYFFVIFLGSHL